MEIARIIVLGAFAVLLLADTASAQPWKTTEEDRRARHDNEVTAYVNALGLDEVTGDTVHAIMDGAFAKREDVLKAAFEGGPGGREEMLKQMQTIDAELENDLAGVLNTEQIRKYTSMRDERRESMRSGRRPNRRGDRRSAPPGQ